jgi:DNA-binding LacI/PurR family transcriptional regulator
MKKSMIRLKDVAARARVSTMTVSNVLNNRLTVSPGRRDRVLQAIKDLKYQPNGIAQSMRTNRTQTVGMIMPDIANPFFPAVVRGAEDKLEKYGYSLIVGNSDSDTTKEESYYQTLLARRVDGLFLIASATTGAPEYLRRHDFDKVPIVFIDCFYHDVPADAVLSDNLGGSLSAVNHLFDRGHRRIAIITGPLTLENAKMRIEGYKRSLTLHDVRIENNLIREGEYHVQSGYQQTKALLRLKTPPTALFVSNGPMALGSMRAIREAKIACPEELALVTFDDMEWFEASHPSISGVAQDPYGIGKTAARLLLDRLRGKSAISPRQKILPTKLTLRESSEYYRKGDPVPLRHGSGRS